VSEVILRIERDFEEMLAILERRTAHLPSRVRSLVWIQCAAPVMAEYGMPVADPERVRAELLARLPQGRRKTAALPAVVNA
jgi:hypothetical protein